MVAWIWKPTKDLFALHLFCWGRFLVRKMVFSKWLQSARSSVQVNGQLIIKAWSVLQQARDEAQWNCHGQTFSPSCLPGCCHVSPVRDCYPPFPLLLTKTLLSALLGCRTGSDECLEVEPDLQSLAFAASYPRYGVQRTLLLHA